MLDKTPVVDAQTLIDVLYEDEKFAPQVDKWASPLTEEVAKNLFVKYCFGKARANPTIGIVASAFMDRKHPLVVIDVTSSMTKDALPDVQSITAIPVNEARQWAGLPPLPSKLEQESLTLPKTSYPNRKVPDVDLSDSPTTKHNRRKKAQDAIKKTDKPVDGAFGNAIDKIGRESLENQCLGVVKRLTAKRSKKSDSAIPPADPSGEEIDQLAMEVATAPLKASAEKTLAERSKKSTEAADVIITTSKSAGAGRDIPNSNEDSTLTPERRMQLQNNTNNRKRAHLNNEREALKIIGEACGPLISAGTLITTLLNLSRDNEAVGDYLRFCFGKPKTK